MGTKLNRRSEFEKSIGVYLRLSADNRLLPAHPDA